MCKQPAQTVHRIDSQSPLSNNDETPEPAYGQTPLTSQRQSQQATPRHPSDHFPEHSNHHPRTDQRFHHNNFSEKDSVSDSQNYTLPRHNKGISSSWAAFSTAHNNPTTAAPSAYTRPLSTHAPGFYDDVNAQVKHLLATTAHNLGKGNSPPYDFHYEYILRGPEKIKATINSVTLPEHLWVIFRIIHDVKTDPDLKPCLMIHIEQIVEDAREFEWEAGVRRWSEVFSRVTEGRLLNGWHSYDEIQRMRMVIAQSKSIVSQPHAQFNSRNTYNNNTYNRTQRHQSQPSQEILKGGPPCPEYNSATGCTLNSGHIKHGKRLVHVCSFCLQHTSAANTHPEVYCRNS